MSARLWRRRASHRTRIVALVLASGLPVLVLAIFGLWRYLDASKQQLVDDRVQMAQAAALTTQAFLADVTGTAQTLALSPELTEPGRRPALPSLLERVRATNPDWDQIAVVDTEGHSLASAGAPPVDSPRLRSLIGQVLESGKASVAAVEANPGAGARLLVGIPLTFGDGTRGVLLVSPSIRVLAAELRAEARGPQLEFALVDGRGATLIAPPQSSSNPAYDPAVLDSVRAGDVGSRQIGDLLMAYAPVSGARWLVVLTQPTSVAFAPLERQVELAVGALILALVAAGLMAWALGGRLSLYYQRIIEARDRAEQATLARDSLLASVSHDLQNPLAAAKGYLQLLQRRIATDPRAPAEKLEPTLAQTQRALLRMQYMIQELVDSARLQAGYELSLRPSLTDLHALLEQVVDEQSAAAYAGDRIHLDTGGTEIWMVCDASRIARVVANVLSNALKYSSSEQPVVLELRHDDEWVTISVADEGIGIPPDELPHLFSRFHRAHNVTSGGTGLGLAGARSIIEQHGGTIEIESHEGLGTNVRIRLPRGAQARQELAAAS
jgi:signal transduction histidine kinase